MNALKRLNKEQWTALAAVILGGFLLLLGFAGEVMPGAETLPTGAGRFYERLRLQESEIPDGKAERYLQGRRIFTTHSVTKLPIPVLQPPQPREEDLPAPLFRPGPVLQAYNSLAVPVKYPPLGTAIIAEPNLPTAAEVDALLKIEDPVAPLRTDRRGEREREFLVVTLKNEAKFEGKEITFESAEELIFRDNKTGNRVTFKKSAILRVDYNRTYEDQFKIDTARINPGPREAEDRLKLAQRLVELGMIKEAREELQKALDLKKDCLEAILLIGQLALESADFNGALAAYQAGLLSGAAPADLHFEIGKCLRMVGFTEGAAAEFERALESSPRHHRAKLALARAQIDTGQIAAGGETAADFFIKLGSSIDTTAAHRAEGYLLRGLAALRAGVLDKARSDLAETLKIDARNGEAMNGLGVVAVLEGKYPQAAPEFVKAIHASPWLTDAWTNLATLHLLGGKWAEAEILCAAAAQRDPVSVNAVLGQGLAQLLAGKKDAPGMIDRAMAMDPHDLQVHMGAGYIRLREGSDEEALARFIAALRAEYHYLPAYSGAAAAYLRTARKLTGEKAQEMRVNAETLLRTVKDFASNRAGAWVALGCAYAVMARPDDARQALRMAALLQKEPDPLIYYALGYVEHLHGQAESDEARLELAHREFSQAVKLKGVTTDPFSLRVIADCEAAIEQINDWNVMSVRFIEGFEGENAKSIGSGWIEADDKYAIAITRENSKERGGRARFSGKQSIRNMGLTSLARDIPGDDFHSLEITFHPEKMAKAEFGVSMCHAGQGGAQTGFHVGVDMQGKVRFNPNASVSRDMDGRDMTVGWVEVKTPLPNEKEITFRLTRTEKSPRVTVLNLWYWDPAKNEWILAQKEIPFNSANAKGNWQVSAWVRAWQDQEILLYVDNFKVFERSRRGP